MSYNEPEVSKNATEAGERFDGRILESGVDSERFIPAEPGTKRPKKGQSWQGNAVHPDEVDRDSLIETGNGLLVIDVDDVDGAPRWVWELIRSTPTLMVRSPHAEEVEERQGGHYYYLLEESPFDGNERVFEWGEVKYGALTVTPGSEIHGLRGGKDCDEGCCSKLDPGRYTIGLDHPIRAITPDDLPIEEELESEPAESGHEPVATGRFDFDVRDRIEHGRECNETFDALCRWAKEGGNPSRVGYRGDRSGAEWSLAWHLSFWMERNEDAVREALDYLNPPKWAEAGETYEESVLKAIEKQPEQYTGSDGESRPSIELTAAVQFDLLREGPMSTAELAESVNYGETQTRKALDYLEEKDAVEYNREGRSGVWQVTEERHELIHVIEDELNPVEKGDWPLGR